MQRSNAGRLQLWLILFLVALAFVLSLVILALLTDRRAAQQPVQPAAGATQVPGETPTVAARLGDAPPQSATPAVLPTPTFVPVGANIPSREPTAAIIPGPELSSSRAQTPPPPRPTAVPIVAAGSNARLDDDAWQGGFRNTRGYGGRSATWIYGTGTQYSSMQAAVALPAQPRGSAQLTIEGMDSEDRPKTTIQITVNDVAIFAGPNPLPNDDLPLESGTWAQAAFAFDAALLRPGNNVIRISNLKPGRFGLPPFFMLDYAVLSFDTAAGAAR